VLDMETSFEECDKRIHLQPSNSSSHRSPILLVHGAFAARLDFFWTAWQRWADPLWPSTFVARPAGREKVGRSFHMVPPFLVRSERFDSPLIVIAHWLGALLAQRLLGRTRIAALLVLAPVPPEGTSLITPFLFATEPSIWRALLNFLCGRRPAFDGMVDIVFSERMRKIEADQHAARMVFERFGAVSEAHVPTPVGCRLVIGVPRLVVAGAKGRLISPLACIRTALFHGAEDRTQDELGHFIQAGARDSALLSSSSIGLSKEGCDAAAAARRP